MLAPLHWHDYKRKYGKLDDFVASHPEVSFLKVLSLHDSVKEDVNCIENIAVFAVVSDRGRLYSAS